MMAGLFGSGADVVNAIAGSIDPASALTTRRIEKQTKPMGAEDVLRFQLRTMASIGFQHAMLARDVDKHIKRVGTALTHGVRLPYTRAMDENIALQQQAIDRGDTQDAADLEAKRAKIADELARWEKVLAAAASELGEEVGEVLSAQPVEPPATK
jgi:hypothetical protein